MLYAGIARPPRAQQYPKPPHQPQKSHVKKVWLSYASTEKIKIFIQASEGVNDLSEGVNDLNYRSTLNSTSVTDHNLLTTAHRILIRMFYTCSLNSNKVVSAFVHIFYTICIVSVQ